MTHSRMASPESEARPLPEWRCYSDRHARRRRLLSGFGLCKNQPGARPAGCHIGHFGASRETPRRRWIKWGSAIAALLWLIASGGFSWYAANFGNFNATYGSLGAVIGFMTWLWISAIIILLGAEIEVEMEHQTAWDTATGSRRRTGRMT
jgi:hypothetical protein